MMDRNTCCVCKRICRWDADCGTCYGCADPSDPQPYDPEFWCNNCAEKERLNMVKRLKESPVDILHKPYWIMPRWAIDAMNIAGWKIGEKAHTITRK